MRSQEEIVARIEKARKVDLLNFEWPRYLDALDFEHAKPYLKEESWEEEKKKPVLFKTAEDIRTRMVSYMPFAWEKANNCRGISAGRSISHYVAWLWLLGEEKLAGEIENYEFYGKPQLRQICEFLGLNADDWDDEIRVNSENEL